MSESITIDTVMIDWITATTFSQETYWGWVETVNTVQELGVAKPSKKMQYRGTLATGDGGSVFLGQAQQRGARHYMMQISGELADFLSPMLYPSMRTGFVRITRLDIQATISQPSSWGQWEFFNRMKRQGKNVGWVESTAKKKGHRPKNLATVYVNARTSSRFARVYQKLTANFNLLLRLEVENKGDVSQAIFRRLSRAEPNETYKIKQAEVLNFAQKDDKLHLLFADVCTGALNPVKVTAKTGNTKAWLIDTCFVSLRRFLNSHDAEENQELIDEIALLYAAYVDTDSGSV